MIIHRRIFMRITEVPSRKLILKLCVLPMVICRDEHWPWTGNGLASAAMNCLKIGNLLKLIAR